MLPGADAYNNITDKSLTKDERDSIIVIFILAFFVIFFWACFEQAGASYIICGSTGRQSHEHSHKQICNFWMHYGTLIFLGKSIRMVFRMDEKDDSNCQVITIGVLACLTFNGSDHSLL